MNDNKVKISELTAATNIGDSDVVAGVVNGNTEKIPVSVLKQALGSKPSLTMAFSGGQWTELVDSDPFAYSATFTVLPAITEKYSTAELINDDAVLFARYGFQLNSYDQEAETLSIYATSLPNNPTLHVKFME